MTSSSNAQDFIEDLLSHIFLQCLPDDGLAQIRLNQAPLNLSQVCRHWRFVSLSTQRLWASLALVCTDNVATEIHVLPMFRLFLRRSGTANFHVKIDCVNSIFGGTLRDLFYTKSVDCTLLEEVLNELVFHAERVKSLIIIAAATLCDSVIHFVQQGELSTLDFLTLQLYNAPGATAGRGLMCLDDQFWRAISNLRCLEIKSGNYQIDLDGGVSCPSLQKLGLHIVVDLNDMFQLLGLFPDLKSFYFQPTVHSEFVSHVSATDITGPRSFPSVRCLEVVNNGGYIHDDRDFMQNVRFPNLRCLSVRGYEPIAEALENFVTTCRPPLEELNLIPVTYWSRDGGDRIGDLLPLLPTLKKLQIPPTQSAVRALLRSNAGAEDTCPLLEEITIRAAFVDSVTVKTWNLVGGVIRSRWKPMDPLRESQCAESEVAGSTTAAAPSTERSLRRVILPNIRSECWKTHQLYKCIKDCQSEVSFTRSECCSGLDSFEECTRKPFVIPHHW